ncbi:MAG: hypothetical protein JWP52_1492, partial [Rhizobacter sp.]|nr:hypothetical protein [Rhizobacter sp.]
TVKVEDGVVSLDLDELKPAAGNAVQRAA